MMLHVFGRYSFRLIGPIEPDRDEHGAPIRIMPQSRYSNSRSLALNPHGHGPFCKFTIARGIADSGVYVITLTGVPAYVGKCQSLADRFGPRG